MSAVCTTIKHATGRKDRMSITFIAWKDTLSDTEIRAENLLVRAGGRAITSKFEGRVEVSESSFRYKGYSFLFINSFNCFKTCQILHLFQVLYKISYFSLRVLKLNDLFFF